MVTAPSGTDGDVNWLGRHLAQSVEPASGPSAQESGALEPKIHRHAPQLEGFGGRREAHDRGCDLDEQAAPTGSGHGCRADPEELAGLVHPENAVLAAGKLQEF